MSIYGYLILGAAILVTLAGLLFIWALCRISALSDEKAQETIENK